MVFKYLDMGCRRKNEDGEYWESGLSIFRYPFRVDVLFHDTCSSRVQILPPSTFITDHFPRDMRTNRNPREQMSSATSGIELSTF